MKIKLFHKEYKVVPAWAVDETDILYGYISFSLLINRHVLLTFSINLPNKSFTGRNPFKLFCRALESENVGMIKYDAIKERLRNKALWEQL